MSVVPSSTITVAVDLTGLDQSAQVTSVAQSSQQTIGVAVLTGPKGDDGPQGDIGPAGEGMPEGGAAGQVLLKNSSNDFDLAWGDFPAALVTHTFVVDSEGEMLALAANIGDVAVRTDLNTNFILKNLTPNILANWQELLGGGGGGSVASVNGQTGVVVLSKTDLGLSNVDNTTDANKPVSTATQTALDTKVQVGGDIGGTITTPTVIETHLSTALPIDQGGTGSTTKQFVDLSSDQTIVGVKTFSSTIGGNINGYAAGIIPAANVDMLNHKLINVTDPSSAQDAATKAYVDANVTASTPDSTASVKGKLQLAGDLAGANSTATAPIVRGIIRVFDVRDYGGVGDGVVADESAAFNAAYVAAAAAAVTSLVAPIVYFKGRYNLTSTIVPKQGVSLRGAGIGKSVLLPFGAIAAVQDITTKSKTTPFKNMVYEDFEIDGINQAAGSYTSAYKGIYTLYHKRVTFRNLYIHDTGATGLGVDFMQECVIDNVVTDNTGRLNDGTQPGGNGIGIGVGRFDDVMESLIITNCHALNGHRFGIFIETQNLNKPTGTVITNCTLRNNQYGLGEAGGRGSIYANNEIYGNTIGIRVNQGSFGTPEPGIEALLLNNSIYNNGVGISFESTGSEIVNDYQVNGNRIDSNTGAGIQFIVNGTECNNVIIQHNKICNNGLHGIIAKDTSTTGAFKYWKVSGNSIYNNGTVTPSAGIRFERNCTDVTINDNKIYDTQSTKTQTYALELSSTSAKTFTGGSINNNDFRNNLTSAVNLNNFTLSATTYVNGNMGYTSNNSYLNTQDLGSGVGVMGIANVVTLPSVSPLDGIVAYSHLGIMKYLQPSGATISLDGTSNYVTPRTNSVASYSSAITPVFSLYNVYHAYAQNDNVSVNLPTGLPFGCSMTIRFNMVADKTFTPNGSYVFASGFAAPGTLLASNTYEFEITRGPGNNYLVKWFSYDTPNTSAVASITYLTTVNSPADSNQYTFSSTTLGTEADDRNILVGITGRKTGSTTSVTGVTIAGVAATQIAAQSTTGTNTTVSAFWMAQVPLGAAGDIIVTFGGTMVRVEASIYSLSRVNPIAYHTVGSTANDPTGSLNVITGGVAVGIAGTNVSASATWIGLTEDYDNNDTGETGYRHNAASLTTGSTTALTVTCDYTAGNTESAGVFVSFQKV